MPDQDQAAIILQGQAMVRLIEAADVLLPTASKREARYLRDLQAWYRLRLHHLVTRLPVEASAQILAVSEHRHRPSGDTPPK